MKKSLLFSISTFLITAGYFSTPATASAYPAAENISFQTNSAEAQAPASQDDGKLFRFLFVGGDDMFYLPVNGNKDELDRLYSVIDLYRPEIVSGAMPIHVDGYSASANESRQNLNLSFIRANRVKSELIIRKDLKEDNFITKNYVNSYTAPDGTVYRDMVVVTLSLASKPEKEPAPKPEPKPAPEPKPEPKPEPAPQQETKSEPAPQPVAVAEPVRTGKDYSGWDLRTNLLYDALLTPTLGVEWRISNHVGVKLDVSWADWGNAHGRRQKIWVASPEIRWYMLDNKRFYLGLGSNVGEANIYKGLASVLSSYTGYKGKFYGGGVTFGYRLPLNSSERLAMDFNLGLGLTHFRYDTFTMSNERRKYNYNTYIKNFWGPTQAGVTLIWRMGRQ